MDNRRQLQARCTLAIFMEWRSVYQEINDTSRWKSCFAALCFAANLNWVQLSAVLLTCTVSFTAEASEPCRIEVTEKGTAWPVPLVELRTTHNVRFVTDNAGVIACDLPELMGEEKCFTVV
jgi:hypothetical protein